VEAHRHTFRQSYILKAYTEDDLYTLRARPTTAPGLWNESQPNRRCVDFEERQYHAATTSNLRLQFESTGAFAWKSVTKLYRS